MAQLLGSAAVKIVGETSGFDKAIDKSLKKMSNFTGVSEKSLKRLGKGFVALAAVASAAFVKISLDSIKFASDLEEVNSKFSVVFKGQEEVAKSWSKTLTESYGQSERESKEFLSSIQDLLVPMGVAAKDAGKLSFEVVKLATDLGSFNNVLTQNVIADFQSALVGNFETMKKYGVVLTAASVQQKALALGLKNTKKELTAADKAQAAYQIIVESSSAAVGDFVRTSAGYANTSKRLTSTWEDFNAVLGEKFLPTATKAKEELILILKSLTDIVKESDEIIKSFKGMSDSFDLFIKSIPAGQLGAVYKVATNAEKVYTDFQKSQSQKRIDEYKSYLGILGGIFDDRYNDIIKKEEAFLKSFEKNIDLGLGNAFKDKGMIGQVTLKSGGSSSAKDFDKLDLDLEGITEFDEALEREAKILAELATAQQKEIDLIDKKNAITLQIQEDEKKRLEMLDSFIKTSPAFKTTEKDDSTFVDAVNEFGGGVTAYLAGIQAMLDLPSQIVDAITGIVDTIADFPTTLSNSVSSLGESVSGFASGGFGWRGKEEERERKRAEQARLAELRTSLETEWDNVIAVFDLSPLETSLYNLNQKYAEQVKLAAASGASIEKLNEARRLEIESITQAALEASQAQFSGLYTGIEGLRRTAALDKSANPFSFLLDEFVVLDEQIAELVDSTDEQIKLQEQQVSTLSDMYNLAQNEAANLKASNDAVQAMIDQLTLQSVGTSFENIEARYNELFNQALTTLDTGDIQSFLTFTNDYMETLEAAGMDAETVRISTTADLEYLQTAIGSQLTVVEENTNAILELTNAVEVLAQSTQAIDEWQIEYDKAFSGTFQTVDPLIYTYIDALNEDLSKNMAWWVREEKEALLAYHMAQIQSVEDYNAAIQAERDAWLAANPQPAQAQGGGGGQMVTFNFMLDTGEMAQSVVLQISNSGELTQVLQDSVN